MDLRQLTCFTAVAETRHLGRAAQRLNLSQPPLTRHIRQLEDELGVQLFLRTPRGMEPTQAGLELLRHARNIHASVELASERTRLTGQGRAGRMDIGVYGSSNFGVIPELLTRFRACYPAVEVVLHNAQTPAQLSSLRQGKVELVFERLLPQASDIEVEHVAREPLLLALSQTHPLAARRVVDIAALKNEPLIIGSSPTAAAMALNLCQAHGFEPRIAAPVTDVVTATLLAATGAGVTFVPWSMTHVQFPGITYRPIQTRVPAFMDLHCFYLREADSALRAAMLTVVREFRSSWRAPDREAENI